ncbi:MAG: hypothetical protein LBP76_12815 [Treponema sp.]|nr:hypothetical protein [Treponema sp.]
MMCCTDSGFIPIKHPAMWQNTAKHLYTVTILSLFLAAAFELRIIRVSG